MRHSLRCSGRMLNSWRRDCGSDSTSISGLTTLPRRPSPSLSRRRSQSCTAASGSDLRRLRGTWTIPTWRNRWRKKGPQRRPRFIGDAFTNREHLELGECSVAPLMTGQMPVVSKVVAFEHSPPFHVRMWMMPAGALVCFFSIHGNTNLFIIFVSSAAL